MEEEVVHTERKLIDAKDKTPVAEDNSDEISDDDDDDSKVSVAKNRIPLKDIVHPPKIAIEKGIKATDMPIKIVWKDIRFSTRVVNSDESSKGGCGAKPMKNL